ncbi:tannase/feruloyl esterase family alpha/beta hydrolase [soil metagenome]
MKTIVLGTSAVVAASIALIACGGGDDGPVGPVRLSCAVAASQTASAPLAGTTLRITSAVAQAASGPTPSHCLVEGAMNERTSAVDGTPYAIKFRMRLPDEWNRKFFMPGGGGSNGVLGDATGAITGFTSALARGYAVVVTDSGHDNAVNSDPAAGGASAFGRDPIARLDFGYRSYDYVARIGKQLATTYYGEQPAHSYFMGCSEGGREAMLVTQRFPNHFDGVVAGCPAMSTPIVGAYSSTLAQTFAPLAIAAGAVEPGGRPLVNKVYTDQDVQLIATAILAACDSGDGVLDGMVQNIAACNDAVVLPQLAAITCTGAKTAACVTAEQVTALRTTFAGPKTSSGAQIYPGMAWDPGIGGLNGSVFNQGWRSWWMGTYNSPSNDSILMTLRAPQHSMVYTTPPVPLTVAQNFDFELNFDRDEIFANANRTTPVYTTSAVEFGMANSTNLTSYRLRGGKLIVYNGMSDPAVSSNEVINWWTNVNTNEGGRASDFVRLFMVPGMNHGSGGPATDRFDMLTALEAWVERGQAPASILATATSPGYFGAASRTRPLCPYPQYAHYNGSGDINEASNFACR